MHKDLYWVYVWSHEAYRDDINILKWYKCIRYNASDKDIGIEVEVEVDIGGWGMQWPEGFIVPDRELELNK